MDLVVQIIGMFFVLIAIAAFLKPDVLKRLMRLFKKGKRIYFAALIRFALAVVFLLAARECKDFWVIFVIALLFIVSGLSVLALGARKGGIVIDWFQRQPTLLVRLLMLVPMALGVLIIISA
jgi:hypothetical protein